jgi:protocatechuate 3,4-dioxygenase beta subunit
MNRLYQTGIFIILCSILTSCSAQERKGKNTGPANIVVGGAFENRELTYAGMPRSINATDTSPGWNQKGQRILLTGTVYHIDEKTPAPDVLLYYYQTNTEGRYLHKPDEERSMAPNEKGQTHGYIRGWVKTDSAGRYFIYTVKPGAYPTWDEPAHIHFTVKEPNPIVEYYIDDVVFDDDKLLTQAFRNKLANRGGSGVLRLAPQGDLQVGKRNIILGLNIPDYPRK